VRPFAIGAGTARWKSPIDAGSASYSAPAFYVSQAGPIDTNAWLVDTLLARPDKTMNLLPGGTARAVKLADLDVGSGAAKQTITLWAISGISTSPLPVWADANNKFFGVAFGLAWLPEAYAGEQARIQDAQASAMAAQAPALLKSLVTVPAGPVAFSGVRLFDAEGARFLANQTVVVDKGVITASGAAGSVTVPAGAQVIDGRGKTLVPGLWDCHMHVGDDYTGLQELSMGVTSIRDPGNDDVRTIDRRTRAAAGSLLMPHVYPSSLIDGKGTYTAQVANVATSEAEAVALVAKAKANGFTGVKFYGTLNPAWLPRSIAEAHKLGLHVHGHIPAGIRPLDAINAGYDEVTHINWIMMQAMPDSVIRESNGILRFEGPGTLCEGREPRRRRDEDDDRHDGEQADLQRPDDGGVREFVRARERRPVAVLRAICRYPAADDRARLQERRLRGAEGSDSRGLSRELGQDGRPARPDAQGRCSDRRRHRWRRHRARARTGNLRAGRLHPGRGAGRRRPSCRPGWSARIGRPGRSRSARPPIWCWSTAIRPRRSGDLRQTRLVMLDGKLLDADALRRAAGFSGRPH
jgi:hypothetical protein